MFRCSVSPGQALAWCAAPQRRCDGGHGRPAGGVAFPASCTFYSTRVSAASFSERFPSQVVFLCTPSKKKKERRKKKTKLAFVRSVGHVNESLDLSQFSSGRLPPLPSSAFLLWLEEQPAGSQSQQPAHRQAHPHTHTDASHCVTQTKSPLTSILCTHPAHFDILLMCTAVSLPSWAVVVFCVTCSCRLHRDQEWLHGLQGVSARHVYSYA